VAVSGDLTGFDSRIQSIVGISAPCLQGPRCVVLKGRRIHHESATISQENVCSLPHYSPSWASVRNLQQEPEAQAATGLSLRRGARS